MDGPDLERRAQGFIPDGCQGIYSALWEVPTGTAELQNDPATTGGVFPFRPRAREHMHPVVYEIYAWRTPGALAAGQNILLQIGFVQDGFPAATGPRVRLYDSDNVVLLGGLPWEDVWIPGPIPVPQTAGQLWGLFARSARSTLDVLPTQALRVEALWGYQPTVRFAG